MTTTTTDTPEPVIFRSQRWPLERVTKRPPRLPAKTSVFVSRSSERWQAAAPQRQFWLAAAVTATAAAAAAGVKGEPTGKASRSLN